MGFGQTHMYNNKVKARITDILKLAIIKTCGRVQCARVIK
jgi:hypothetical protein